MYNYNVSSLEGNTVTGVSDRSMKDFLNICIYINILYVFLEVQLRSRDTARCMMTSSLSIPGESRYNITVSSPGLCGLHNGFPQGLFPICILYILMYYIIDTKLFN